MDEDQPEVNKTTENTKECEEGKKIIKRYEEVLKTERKEEGNNKHFKETGLAIRAF